MCMTRTSRVLRPEGNDSLQIEPIWGIGRRIPAYAFAALTAVFLATDCSGKEAPPWGVDFSKDYSSVIVPMLLSISKASIARSVGDLVAEWPGADDKRAVIVSAHYDSWGEGHSGAVDMASGCAGSLSAK
jgi:hypothetical protein